MATAVNVLSPEMPHCGKVDGFHIPEDRTVCIETGEIGPLPRGLRQCYDTTRKHRELGRALSCWPMAGTEIGNKLKRQGPGDSGKAVGFVRSSEEAGNDRGAKGRMPVRNVTGKQGNPRRGSE